MTVLKMLSPTCDTCGKTNHEIAEWAQVYRMMELKAGRRNPGNLCGKCAADETATRIISEGKTVIDASLIKEQLREETKH